MPAKSVIVYSCEATCGPDVLMKKLRPRKFVYLVAEGTDVMLRFLNSPFDPPDTTVTIPEGTVVKRKTRAKGGAYPYVVTCNRCVALGGDPTIILEL